jgi:chromosome segregation ATPase
MKELEQ